MDEPLQWHPADEIGVVLNGYGTTLGYHERCRRCGTIWRGMVIRSGPCTPAPPAAPQEVGQS